MLLTLFLAFLKIGFLGFGGGYAMLSLIFQEGQKFGLTVAQFADLNAIDVLIPGPIAINSATYIGQLFGGFTGALITTVAVSLPSLLLVPLYLAHEKKIQQNRWLKSFLAGIKNAATGLLFAVAATIILETVFHMSSLAQLNTFKINGLALFVFSATLWLHLKYQLNPILLTLVAGVLGYGCYFF